MRTGVVGVLATPIRAVDGARISIVGDRGVAMLAAPPAWLTVGIVERFTVGIVSDRAQRPFPARCRPALERGSPRLDHLCEHGRPFPALPSVPHGRQRRRERVRPSVSEPCALPACAGKLNDQNLGGRHAPTTLPRSAVNQRPRKARPARARRAKEMRAAHADQHDPRATRQTRGSPRAGRHGKFLETITTSPRRRRLHAAPRDAAGGAPAARRSRPDGSRSR